MGGWVLVTEDDAKTKWCPFTRVGEQASGAAENRPDGSFNCIGSACMAWRWKDDIERRWTQDAPEGDGWQRVEAIGGVAHWVRTHKTPHGFCGIAGHP
jgi:hypothetical protein